MLLKISKDGTDLVDLGRRQEIPSFSHAQAAPKKPSIASRRHGCHVYKEGSAAIDKFHAMILRLREYLIAQEAETSDQLSAPNIHVLLLQCALDEQKAEQDKLSQRLATSQIESAKLEEQLTVMAQLRESFETSLAARAEELKQARRDLDALLNLAKDARDRLANTAFKSRGTIVLSILEPFWREFLQKYAGPEALLPLSLLNPDYSK